MKAELGCDRISDARDACCAVMFHFSLPPDGPLQIFFRISGFQLSGPPHPRSGIPKAPDASDDPSPGCCPEILAAHSRRRGVECVGSDREFPKLLRGDHRGRIRQFSQMARLKGGEGGKGGESARNHRLRRLFRLPSARMRKLSPRFESDEFGRQGDGGEKRRFSPA